MGEKSDSQVVMDVGKWEWSELIKKEDWWAVWLGFFILLMGVLIYFPHADEMKTELVDIEGKYLADAQKTDKFKTIGWYQLNDAKQGVKAKNIGAGKWLATFSKKPYGWKTNPLDAFFMTQEAADAKKASAVTKYESAKAAEETALTAAQAAEATAEAAGFNDTALNEAAKTSIADWRNAWLKASKAKAKTKVSPYNQVGWLIFLGVCFAVFFGVGMAAMGKSFKEFVIGFSFVYLVAVLAYLASSQATMKTYGVGYAFWAIFGGMLISNTVGTPKWAMPAVQTEYYIKTGLVLLGASILFEKIITIGTRRYLSWPGW